MKTKFVFAFLALFASAALAEDPGLKKIESLRLVVESIDASGRSDCGITEDDIRTAARFILQQSKLKLTNVPAAVSPYLYVNAQALYVKGVDLCFITVTSTVKVFATAVHNGVLLTAEAWSEGRMEVSYRRDASSRLSKVVEDQMKRLVAAWAEVNP